VEPPTVAEWKIEAYGFVTQNRPRRLVDVVVAKLDPTRLRRDG
jgi:hypothetical protein